MLIAASEGSEFRYEVLALAEGFLVQPRDIEKGSIDELDLRLFRTAPAALAYAELSAAADIFVASQRHREDDNEIATRLEEGSKRFRTLSATLCDRGYLPNDVPPRAVTHH